MNYTQDQLQAVQIELEKRGRDLGAERYDNRTDKALQGGRGDETSFGASTISKNVIQVRDALQEALTPRKQYRIPAALKLIEDVDLGVLSMVTLSGIIRSLMTSKTVAASSTSIAKAVFHEKVKANLDEEGRKHFANLISKSGAQGRDAVKALDYVKDIHESTLDEWTKQQQMAVGRTLLEITLTVTDFFEVVEGTSTGKEKTPDTLKATESFTSWVQNHRDELRLLSPVYLPMVVPPRDWTAENVLNGCYITNEQAPVPFTKRKKKAQIRRLKEENPENVFEAVNLIQSTAWRVRKPVLNLLKRIQDERINLDLPISSMPPQVDAPIDEEASYRDQKLQEQHNQEVANIRALVNVNIATAEEFSEFDRFYVPHHLDTRGRVYPIPALNPQGADYIKGLLEFADGKALGTSGVFWLKVHTANLFGVDKVPFEDRVQWVNDNWSDIIEAGLSPLRNLFWTKADKPIQAFAACHELLGVSIQGPDYVSRMPIALDGSCSGLQHLGAAFRCEITAKAVNLVDGPKPNDIYRDVAEKVQAMLENETIEENKILATQWLAFSGGTISRKITKRPVMTFPYGSKAPGFTQQLMDDTLKPAIQKNPAAVPFDNARVAAQYLARLIEKAVSATVLKAAEAMDWMQKTATNIAIAGTTIEWTTPLGFPVVQEYRKTKSRQIDSVVFGKRLRSRILEETDEIDARKMANAIAPNVVHSLDSSHLLLTVLRGSEEGITQFALIHDSFGTYAADTDRFFYIIREAFAEMYEEDVFGYLEQEFARQIDAAVMKAKRKKTPQLPTKGSYNLEAIKSSSFSFA